MIAPQNPFGCRPFQLRRFAMETNSPIVTILLPTYNCEAHVRESIQSMLDQTFTDFELIVIDDASTDGTVACIQAFDDPRIYLIQKKTNAGYTDSLLYGIDVAKGRYIARMDADDISMTDRLEKQVHYLDAHPDVVLCGCWYQEIPTQHIAQLPVGHEEIKVALLTSNAICHPSVMYRKDFFVRHRLTYNRDFEPAEDYELWTRVIALGKISNIPEVLLHYRLHDQQVSAQRNAYQRERAALCRKNMLLYLTDAFSPEDEAVLLRILTGTRLRTVAELQQALRILHHLSSLNAAKAFYLKPAFTAFIEAEKKMLIRHFFIFHTHYNLGILRCFFRLPEGRTYLSRAETARLLVKSLIGWRTSE